MRTIVNVVEREREREREVREGDRGRQKETEGDRGRTEENEDVRWWTGGRQGL